MIKQIYVMLIFTHILIFLYKPKRGAFRVKANRQFLQSVTREQLSKYEHDI